MSSSKTSRTRESQISVQPLEGLRSLFQKARLEAGLDVEALAINSLVPVASILQLEVAPQKVRLEHVYAVANALNLDPGVVLDLLHSVPR
jgi:hypothetical protein